MATKPLCVLTPKHIQFQVIRQPPEFITPAIQTPYEFKELSNLDDQEGLRFQVPFIMFYPGKSNPKKLDPVIVIKNAISKALVYYYPLAGRVREKEGRKLVVECNAKGVLFIEADAPNLTLDDFGESGLVPPIPCFDQLLYNDPNDPHFADNLHTPLLFQVTRLRCGGFIVAFRMNHTLVDGAGLVQFFNTVAEIAREEKSLSVFPVWERHILRARDPPRVNVSIPAYDNYTVPHPSPITITPNDDKVTRSFFFGPTEISALRCLVPPHLKTSTRFEILSACLWRCRTIAIQPEPDEYVRFMIALSIRPKFKDLPIGYYGNGIVFPMAITTAIELSQNPLGYAIELIKKAKAQVAEEYIRSVVDLMEIKGRPLFNPNRNFTVSDITSEGYTFEHLDYGWGLPTYAGPTLDGVVKEIGDLLSFFVSFKNGKGEKGLVFMMRLPILAMKRFQEELQKMLDPSFSTGSFGPISSAL